MPASDKDSFNEEVNIFRLSDTMESYWRRYFANMTFDDIVASVALVRPSNRPYDWSQHLLFQDSVIRLDV